LNPRRSPRSPDPTRRLPAVRGLAVLVILLSLACQTRYRSAVSWPGDSVPLPTTIASAGIRQSASGTRDEAASALLVEKSGYPDVGPALSEEEVSKLLSDPARLAHAAGWRNELEKRIGYRHLVVGDLAQSRVEASKEWLALVLLGIPAVFVAFSIPIAHDRRSDVPHASLALRVIDLATGRIQSEFFAMMPARSARDGLSDHHVETALRAMGLVEAKR